ncbi:MAG: response regulator [Candidatus Magasanikbacteria bacterium]|nr:response regulator [Candidatus Magasanikbacteria bacterium]
MSDTKKVLIIEDDTMISSMYKTKLEQDGYAVVCADNGSEGLEKAKVENADIILLDVIMPQLDGFTVLEEMRGKMGIKVPIIMLTNLGTEEDRAKGEKLGATDYLVKASITPSQVSELVAKNLK